MTGRDHEWLSLLPCDEPSDFTLLSECAADAFQLALSPQIR